MSECNVTKQNIRADGCAQCSRYVEKVKSSLMFFHQFNIQQTNKQTNKQTHHNKQTKKHITTLYARTGSPLIIHLMVGLGKPLTLQSNSAVSSTSATTFSGGLLSRQNGVARQQNHTVCQLKALAQHWPGT